MKRFHSASALIAYAGLDSPPYESGSFIGTRRKISTYINALAKSGFVVEEMIEQNDQQTMESVDDISDKTKKAKMIPISVCFRARKL